MGTKVAEGEGFGFRRGICRRGAEGRWVLPQKGAKIRKKKSRESLGWKRGVVDNEVSVWRNEGGFTAEVQRGDEFCRKKARKYAKRRVERVWGGREGRCGQRSFGLENRRGVNEREEGLSGLRMR